MKDLKETVCAKSSDPVPGAEKYQLRNQAGSSSLSSGLNTNEHHKTVTQGSCSVNHVPCSHEGSRHSTHNIDHPNGLPVDVQADSHQPQQSSAHLSGNESNNARVIVHQVESQ